MSIQKIREKLLLGDLIFPGDNLITLILVESSLVRGQGFFVDGYAWTVHSGLAAGTVGAGDEHLPVHGDELVSQFLVLKLEDGPRGLEICEPGVEGCVVDGGVIVSHGAAPYFTT
jgi:hypothetical protein